MQRPRLLTDHLHLAPPERLPVFPSTGWSRAFCLLPRVVRARWQNATYALREVGPDGHYAFGISPETGRQRSGITRRRLRCGDGSLRERPRSEGSLISPVYGDVRRFPPVDLRHRDAGPAAEQHGKVPSRAPGGGGGGPTRGYGGSRTRNIYSTFSPRKLPSHWAKSPSFSTSISAGSRPTGITGNWHSR